MLAPWLVALSAAGAQSSTAGTTMTTRTTVDSGGAGAKVEVTARQQIAGKRARLQIVFAAGSSTAHETHVIFNNEDSTMLTVTPAQRIVMVMPHLDAFGITQSVTENYTTHTVEDLGSGESILGHATRRYRVTTAGTREITMMGKTCSSPIDAVTEHWIAPDLDISAISDALRNQLATNLRPNVDVKRTGIPATLPKGTALRMLMTSRHTTADGNPITLTTSLEVVELAQGPIADSVFTPPADYRVMDVREMMKHLPPGSMNSAIASTLQAGNLCSP